MTGAKRYKTINGAKFSFDTQYKKKTDARKRAKVLRSRGHNARVIKTKTKAGIRYTVYYEWLRGRGQDRPDD